MRVKVRLFGELIKYGPAKEEFWMDVSSGSTVQDIIDELNIPKNEIWFVTVEGVHVNYEHVLNEKDEIMIFEPVLGG